jgi:hypothetical protein
MGNNSTQHYEKMFKVFLLIRVYSSCVYLASIQNAKHIENTPQNDLTVPFRLDAVGELGRIMPWRGH